MSKCDECGGALNVEAKGMRLDPRARVLEIEGREIRLQPTGTKLMHMLMAADGAVECRTLRDELFPGRIGKNLEVHIHRLRAAIALATKRIEIVNNRGSYELVGQI